MQVQSGDGCVGTDELWARPGRRLLARAWSVGALLLGVPILAGHRNLNIPWIKAVTFVVTNITSVALSAAAAAATAAAIDATTATGSVAADTAAAAAARVSAQVMLQPLLQTRSPWTRPVAPMATLLMLLLMTMLSLLAGPAAATAVVTHPRDDSRHRPPPLASITIPIRPPTLPLVPTVRLGPGAAADIVMEPAELRVSGAAMGGMAGEAGAATERGRC